MRACAFVRVKVRECVRACVCVGVGMCPGAQACRCVCLSVALLIQHVRRMRQILSFCASLAPVHSSTLFRKRHDFWKKVIEHRICVLIFSTTFISVISRSKKNSAKHCHECRNVYM
jgi:hypothetical protein